MLGGWGWDGSRGCIITSHRIYSSASKIDSYYKWKLPSLSVG